MIRSGIVVLVLAALGLAACANTIRGAGRDMQQTGDAVEDTVQGQP